MSKYGVIYTLDDPRTGNPRYVGSTVNPKSRLMRHIRDPVSSEMEKWIGELASDGHTPNMTLIEFASKNNLGAEEIRAIERLQEEFDLLNEVLPPYPRDEPTVSVEVSQQTYDKWIAKTGSRGEAKIQMVDSVVEYIENTHDGDREKAREDVKDAARERADE